MSAPKPNVTNDKKAARQKAAATRVRSSELPVAWIMMLGLIVAIGPLSIDMYLPALPAMADDFGVSTAFMANSVPAYFVGLVFGQLIYGPLSDRVGRVKPLYFGMALYVVASIVCATTSSEYVLFAGRTVQALGACVGAVVTRAAIRDRLTAKQTAKAFSIMILVMGLAPILAPSLGALFLQFFDWHSIFWFLAAFGMLNLLLTKFFFFETLSEENRNARPAKEVLSQYWDLLKDPRFNYPAIGGGLLMGAMFVYISSASELIMDTYGVSATHFGWLFGMNAAGFVGLTQLNQWLTNRFRILSILRFGTMMQVISAAALFIIGLIFGTDAWLPLVLGCIFFCIAGLGLTQPNASAIALAFQKTRAGMASAMQGSLMFSVGIFGGLLLNLFPVNPVLKIGIAMFSLMSLGAFLIWQIDRNLNLDDAE
ncbi:MAG: multidrug effflux MFS transporter [Psychrobacter sp.]|jgi:DHA1 family bicyclomycin/chloramphenicol resistance-like MFS transporter|uniref:multidrug effflux MFS transporter n=1 Tax=unclassified Psychrobacter TaxID=196806 RepID=UPI0004145461|nr:MULTISPECIES: multidrug effflux MFS transporter [unclassified Psychrobacter]HAM61873.1 Bcr/CflA family drug resistance efflux transporter [Psychrobacter sp.]